MTPGAAREERVQRGEERERHTRALVPLQPDAPVHGIVDWSGGGVAEAQYGEPVVAKRDQVAQAFGRDKQRVEALEVELLGHDRPRRAHYRRKPALDRNSVQHDEMLERPELGVGLLVVDVVREHRVTMPAALHELEDDALDTRSNVDPRVIERDALHTEW